MFISLLCHRKLNKIHFLTEINMYISIISLLHIYSVLSLLTCLCDYLKSLDNGPGKPKCI